MQSAIIILSLAVLAAGAPKSVSESSTLSALVEREPSGIVSYFASKGNGVVVRSLDDLAHVGDGEVVRLKRVKRCEFAAAAPENAIVNKRGNTSTDCEDVPTFITNW
ncbi:hypothetical protein CGMCC3_g13896 [Colletotrichum fructicola]|nr:uncharacterized protein CGMCC3_g13896 [Colletotrichum fructicola]KAE9570097.1 hypothetical protein CGMCC3_g13896 [Colletotrichum fructicola]